MRWSARSTKRSFEEMNQRPTCGRKGRVILRPAAVTDLNDIRLFTQQRWGLDQRRRYGGQLRRTLRSLVENPELGPQRDELYPGCRSLVVGSHVIFYSV